MENAGEAVVQDGEDEEGVVQQGQHHLPLTLKDVLTGQDKIDI